MKIFIAGATGAVGKRLCSSPRRQRIRGRRDDAIRRQGRWPSCSRRGAGRARRPGCGGCRPSRLRGRAGRRRSPGHGAVRPEQRAQPRRGVRGDKPLRTVGTDNLLAAAKAAARGSLWRRASPLAVRERGPRREGRRGTARSVPARERRADHGGDSSPRDRRRRRRRDRGDRAPVRRFLRAGYVAVRRWRARRGDSQARVPDRRERRRNLVVRPHRRRRGRDARRNRASTGKWFYNIVDDEPASTSEWLYLAELLGAKPPRHVPEWLGRLVAGEQVVSMMTEARGASNAKAKRELG